MESRFKNEVELPFLYLKNNKITYVNKEFVELTGFTQKELFGKSIVELGSILRINSNMPFENSLQDHNCYIYTQFCKMEEVLISFENLEGNNENIYYFKKKIDKPFGELFPYIYRLLKDNRVGVAIHSIPDLVLLKANQKYLDFQGLHNNSFEKNIGKRFKDRVNKFEGSSAEEIFEKVMKTGESCYLEEFKYEGFYRGITYWDSNIVRISIDGEPKYIIETVLEVTERVEARKIIEVQSKKIEEQKRELEAIIENISDGVIIIDDKGNHKLFNKNARETFFPPKEYGGDVHDWYRNSKLFYRNGNRVPCENYPENRILRGEKFSNMMVSACFPNRTLQIDVSGTPIYDSEGKFVLGVICNRDITECYNQQEIVKNKNEILNRLIDNLELPVFRISSKDFSVLELNQKAFNIINEFVPKLKSVSDIKGNIITDIIAPFKENTYFQDIKDVIKNKKTKFISKKNHVLKGNEVYWNVIMEPGFGINGEIQEILILVIDVTAEIKCNKDMEKALKLQEEFLANISHELKTPLNVIYSTVQLFSMYLINDSVDKNKNSILKYINSMTQNCHRLSKLINNIVDLSKIEAGFFQINLSNNNIVEIIEEIVKSVSDYTNMKGVSIIFDTDSEEKIISCDSKLLERMVLNLISNAIKFSDTGTEIFVGIEDKNEFIEISVKDNGIGIEKDQFDVIFDRFKQVDKSLSRNAEGTGIGLSLVKAIVELHQGQVNVESEIGKGSKFTIALPNRKIVEKKLWLNSSIVNKIESVQMELSDISL